MFKNCRRLFTSEKNISYRPRRFFLFRIFSSRLSWFFISRVRELGILTKTAFFRTFELMGVMAVFRPWIIVSAKAQVKSPAAVEGLKIFLLTAQISSGLIFPKNSLMLAHIPMGNKFHSGFFS